LRALPYPHSFGGLKIKSPPRSACVVVAIQVS
jgi:hypothetical protein